MAQDNNINKFTQLRCPECKQASLAMDWDKATLGIFNNRATRRRYQSIEIKSSRCRGSRRAYVCPICKSIIDGADTAVV